MSWFQSNPLTDFHDGRHGSYHLDCDGHTHVPCVLSEILRITNEPMSTTSLWACQYCLGYDVRAVHVQYSVLWDVKLVTWAPVIFRNQCHLWWNFWLQCSAHRGFHWLLLKCVRIEWLKLVLRKHENILGPFPKHPPLVAPSSLSLGMKSPSKHQDQITKQAKRDGVKEKLAFI